MIDKATDFMPFSAEVPVAEEVNYGLRDSDMAGKAPVGCGNAPEAGCRNSA